LHAISGITDPADEGRAVVRGPRCGEARDVQRVEAIGGRRVTAAFDTAAEVTEVDHHEDATAGCARTDGVSRRNG
jgi:hypothetical protein